MFIVKNTNERENIRILPHGCQVDMVLEPKFELYHESGMIDISLDVNRLTILNKNEKLKLQEDDKIDGFIKANNI